MIKLALTLLLFLVSKYLSKFQLLLLICFIEVKTGLLIGDYYFLLLFLSYLLFRYLWWRGKLTISFTPVAQ